MHYNIMDDLGPWGIECLTMPVTLQTPNFEYARQLLEMRFTKCIRHLIYCTPQQIMRS